MDQVRTTTKPKSILIHAINFAPEIIGCAKYTTELAQYLEHRGHIVTVVTAPPHYPGWSVPVPYRALSYTREMLGSIAVTRCPIVVKSNGGVLWRLLAPLSFAIASAPVVAWRTFRLRPDVVLCVEPTFFSASITLQMAKLLGIRCILHVQDLEVDAAFEGKLIKANAVRKAAAAIECILLRGFDRIITISNKMRERLIAKRVEPDRVVVVRNWIADRIKPVSRNSPNLFRAKLGIGHTKFVVLYAGHIGTKQGLDVIASAARQLKDRDDICFVIAGDGPLKKHLKQDNADLTNLLYLPLQPASELNELLAMADLHVLPQQKWAADLVLPSKLGGMLASGRPIVATVNEGTELADILRDVALLTPAGDYRALSQAICRAKIENLSSLVEKGLALAETLEAYRLLPRFERELFGVEERDLEGKKELEAGIDL
jgi:colanic acid biosynthesis glycosyl transferase WcaI